MSVMTATELAVIQPTLVANVLMLTATNMDMVPLVRTNLNLSGAADGAITFKIGNMPIIAAQTVTVGNNLTAAAPTIGSKSLTKNVNRAVYTEDANTERANSNQEIDEAIIAQAAASLIVELEEELAGKYGSAGITRDAGLNDIAEADFIAMRKAFNQANAPTARRVAVLSATQEANLAGIDRFSRADALGAGGVIMEGQVGKLHGWNIFYSNSIQESSSKAQNLFYVAPANVGTANTAEQTGRGETLLAPEGNQVLANGCSMSYAVGKIPPPRANVFTLGLPFGRVTFDYRDAAAANSIRADMLLGAVVHKTEWFGDLQTNP